MNSSLRVLALLLSTFLAGACRSNPGAPPEAPADIQAVSATVDALYRSFCFDAGGEADWKAMRGLFADGAVFVSPIAAGAEPEVLDADGFIDAFREWIATGEEVKTGLYERVIARRLDVFGNIAQAWIAFEGYVPGTEEATTSGVDSLQFVRAPDRWRLVSFTTQYEGGDVALPSDFMIRRSR